MAVESKRLGCVIVSVDGSEESMNALRWALDNLKLRSPSPDSSGGHLVIFHIQSPPSITAGLNPGAIPFGGPSDLEVPAFTAAIEAHQRKISDAIMKHALQICSDKNVKNAKTHIVVGDPKEKVCEAVEEFHADLLVMGSRSFGPIKRLGTQPYLSVGSPTRMPCYLVLHRTQPQKVVVKVKGTFTLIYFTLLLYLGDVGLRFTNAT
ncbi:universal stress protein PHOS34-like isoform X1 [Camellia sinensis]|uniref:universal stress protein PHOS34-like isoform X1 n=1 Tax=Camellia sinensis TaxID=4442 RepID=UPI0010368ED9|nr:universal stress protein PHOS34-like isoform X1 [Camellia sinensis]